MSQCAFCVESAGLEVNIVCEQVFNSKDFVTSVRVHHKHTKITAATHTMWLNGLGSFLVPHPAFNCSRYDRVEQNLISFLM